MNIDESNYKLPLSSSYNGSDIDFILFHFNEAGGFNDVLIKSEAPISIKTQGRMLRPSRNISHKEVGLFLNHLLGDDTAYLAVMGGAPIDESVEVWPAKAKRPLRYRLNAQRFSIPFRGAGIQLVMRELSEKIFLPEEIGMEQEVVEMMLPRQGLCLVTGETGSGKSTTLAAVIKEAATNPKRDAIFIKTYEAPVEYVHSYPTNGTDITQASVDPLRGDVKTFADGGRNAMRQTPDAILVGEIRDAETANIAMSISNSGHLVWGTLHANSVSTTFDRMAGFFSPEVRESKIYELLITSRSVLVQYLAKKNNGGRVAVKEWLEFNGDVRGYISDQLKEQGIKSLKSIIDDAVCKFGMPMERYADYLFNNGVIDEIQLRKIRSGI